MKNYFLLTFFALFFNLSFSQTNWIKYLNSPVLPRDTTYFPPSNDIIASSDPFVIKEGNIYKMWYTCGGGNYPADTILRARICYCYSNDGINWTKHSGNPVIDVSYNGGWDSLGVETISVIIDSAAPSSQRYKAWYAGQYYNSYRYDIGYAWSPDGIIWTKYGSPVLAVGPGAEWDNAFLEGPSVIKEGSIFKMWYAGYDATVDGQTTDGKVNIGYATSADGINWTKYSGNPVMTTSASGWDLLYVQDPHVIKKDGVYNMWFGGTDYEMYGGYGQQTGYAQSYDGINWIKSAQNPILRKGNTGEWDFNLASFPAVIYDDDGTLKMWYTGRNKDTLPNNLDYYWELGLAIDSSGYFGINDFNLKNTISIYPNPASDFINIIIEKNNIEKQLIIYDHQGRQQIKTSITKSKKIDISDLVSGIYFIRTCNEASPILKFIKI
jgi:predicted GH43/DUF377 family glycosyl hydrolase